MVKVEGLEEVDIRSVWRYIRPVLDKMYLAGGDLPEEIYYECRSNLASFYHGEDGFIVLTEVIDRNTLEKSLLTWIGYSYKPKEDILVKYLDRISTGAKDAGYKKVEFTTHRKGYARVLDDSWKVKATTWEKVLV